MHRHSTKLTQTRHRKHTDTAQKMHRHGTEDTQMRYRIYADTAQRIRRYVTERSSHRHWLHAICSRQNTYMSNRNRQCTGIDNTQIIDKTYRTEQYNQRTGIINLRYQTGIHIG